MTSCSQAVNKSPTHYPCDSARTFRVILFRYSQRRMEILPVFNIKHHCSRIQKMEMDSRIMKAQELKTKTSAQTLIYKIFLQRYQVYQGRLLASFQDDAKYEHVGQDTRSQGGKDDQDKRTIDQLASGKLRDLNAEESWALLEDLALYDNECWNDPRDFAKPVKAIALPQDVPSTSDRRLIELKNQVQRLMEAYLTLIQPTQVNKITTLCEICSGPHDTQYCMEDPEQAFVEYASSHTDEAGGKWYTFKPEQNNLGETYNPSWRSHPNLRLSKSEADFKRQQCEMTNKIDTVLKAITNRIAGTLPSDTVKNPKLETHPVSSAHSYPSIDPYCSSHPSNSINAIKDLHLNLPVLEVLSHAPIYNAILDKYVESLELGKNRSAFVQGEIPAKMKDPRLFTLPCRLGESKPFDTLADLGSCVNIIPLYLFKKLNIRLLEKTNHIFGLADKIKSYPVGIVKDVEVHIGKLKLLNDFYVIDEEGP
ncbi:MAK10-like protein [Tanacetum coccineum]